ncbi:hypothetical protein ACQUJS_05565 [Ralstonia pseudosolanacearum]|uniref:Uncharacterized protein n=1 Tax=Ralstonia solanacearum TaxID=305 RepID=A0A0S4TUU5_RALSL|nr:protein of unknown function [Ralstonia solanacearum]
MSSKQNTKRNPMPFSACSTRWSMHSDIPRHAFECRPALRSPRHGIKMHAMRRHAARFSAAGEVDLTGGHTVAPRGMATLHIRLMLTGFPARRQRCTTAPVRHRRDHGPLSQSRPVRQRHRRQGLGYPRWIIGCPFACEPSRLLAAP